MGNKKQGETDVARVVLYILAIFPYFMLSAPQNILGDTLYQAWQIGAVAIMLYLAFVNDNLVLDRYTVCYSVYQIQVFIVTTVKSEFRPGILATTMAVILIINLIQTDRRNVLLALVIMVAIVAPVNLLSELIIGAGGFSKEYFIGSKNALSIFLIPGIFIMHLFYTDIQEKVKNTPDDEAEQQREKYARLLFWGYTAIAIFSTIYGRSGTGTVVAICAIGCILLLDRIRIPKFYVLSVIVAAYLIILCADSVFQSQVWINFANALGKDPTLTYRTLVWAEAMKIFKANWLFGKGRIFWINYIGDHGLAYVVREAHNLVFQALCDGGVVGSCLYLAAMSHAIGRLDMKIEKQKVLFFALMLMLIIGLTEVINYTFMFILLLALANSYRNEYEDRQAALQPTRIRRII